MIISLQEDSQNWQSDTLAMMLLVVFLMNLLLLEMEGLFLFLMNSEQILKLLSDHLSIHLSLTCLCLQDRYRNHSGSSQSRFLHCVLIGI